MKIWSRRIAQNMNEIFWKILPWYYTIGQNFSNFFVHILGNATTSYIHSEISWPLAYLHISIINLSINLSNMTTFRINLIIFYLKVTPESKIHWIQKYYCYEKFIHASNFNEQYVFKFTCRKNNITSVLYAYIL